MRNLSVAALSAATLQVLEKPVVEPLARLVERRRWGIVPQLGLPRPVEDAVAMLLMDYPRVPGWLVLLSLVYPVFYVALSAKLSGRGRVLGSPG